METKTIIILIVIGIIAVFIAVQLVRSYFSKGKAAERKTAKVLRKVSKGDKVRIMNNVYLPLYNKTCEIDHLVFGRFGILVVETKGISGSISGSGKNLVHKIGTKTHKLYNPELQNKTHIDNVIHHLKKGGFGNTPVYGAVVFTDDSLQRDTKIGMSVNEFKKFYDKIPQHDCNQDALFHHFQKLCVRNPLKKLLHKFSRKDWD
ncbi:MAG: NERD domain-containing protein [Ruminococcus sp.]|jgi:hypothetical protein|nr:NERD domain-containing protein [Ruminococcus sp.]MBQ7027127.1 NERD domain-containing protein [Ruminococcus sp.]MBQ8582240.1 NERD domain-containing protein [Ruminococcus sp.]